MNTSANEQLKIVIVGHVDHGKSTLIGRLFYDTGSLPEGKYEQLKAAAERRGVPFEFANLMDGLQQERDQNITIDTAQIWFRTEKRQYVIIDAPGHKEFLKNMVTGAASAGAALLLIDAHEGVQEQSRRHGYLLKLLGIEQVVVVVNKMDLVDWSQSTFEQVERDYRAFLKPLGVVPERFVPIAARHGDNVAAKSPNLAWFLGPTVLEALDEFQVPAKPTEKPLRFPVQDVYRFDHRRILAGRVESGTLTVGDELLFQPGGKKSRVRTIERWSAPETATATAGESIGITLEDQLFVERGHVASLAKEAPVSSQEFHASLFWMGRAPLVTGKRYKLKLATQEVEAEVKAIESVIDASTLAASGAGRDAVNRNDVAELLIRTRTPVVFDAYDRIVETGRFVLVDNLDVAGGGIITKAEATAVEQQAQASNLTWSYSSVTAEERHARNGHRGAVVWFTGLSGAGKSTLANALERELFTRGRQAFVLDGDNIRYGLCAGLGFSPEDRVENIRRVAQVAKLFAEAGFVAICSFISPYRSDRERAREIVSEGGGKIPFSEIHVATPLEVCEERDPKRLYARARAGEIKSFTGVSAPYEAPEQPELRVDTAATSVEAAVTSVLDHLVPRITPGGATFEI